MKRRDCLWAAGAGGIVLQWPWAQALAAPSAERARTPVAAFARRALMTDMALSPDGRRIAALLNNEDRTLLVTRALNGGQVQVVLATDNLEFRINWIEWISDDRLVLSLSFPFKRYYEGYGNLDVDERRLMGIDADGRNAVNLLKDRGGVAGILKYNTAQDHVIAFMDDGRHLLVGLNSSEHSADKAIYKVDAYTGQRSFYAPSKTGVAGWIVDQQMRPRVCFRREDHDQYDILVCEPDSSAWRVLHRNKPFDSGNIQALGFGLDPHLLYVAKNHQGLRAVFTMDLRETQPQLKLKLSLADRDLNGTLVRDAKGEAVGISSVVLGDSSRSYWDPRYVAWQRELDDALPGRGNTIYDASKDGKTFVVMSFASDAPTTIYTAQLVDPPSMTQLASAYPELEDVKLGKRTAVSFAARDGLPLEAFLTWPPGRQGAKNLPLVVYPHGGPQARDSHLMDVWAAFMADRGCLVMQLNYRGSTGYGQKHLEAGLRRWGLEMQEDLEDGVHELVRREWADPARVVIVGASYGGYAALMGAAKTPKLYKAAFAMAPVTDLVRMASDDGRWGREAVRRQVGDAVSDRQRLTETSPLRLVERIQVPVVLVHGTADLVVPYEHSKWMHSALQEAGKPVKLLTLEQGGHSLLNAAHRRRAFEELDRFLEQALQLPS